MNWKDNVDMGFIENWRDAFSKGFDKLTDQQNTYHRSTGKTQKEYEQDLKTYKQLEAGLIADSVLSAAGLAAGLAPGLAAGAKGAATAAGEAVPYLSKAAGSAAAAKSAAAAGNAALAGQAAVNAARNVTLAKMAGMGIGDAFLGLAPSLGTGGTAAAATIGGLAGAGLTGLGIHNALKDGSSSSTEAVSQADTGYEGEDASTDNQDSSSESSEEEEKTETKSPDYDVDEMAGEFILGAWGNGQDRIDNMLNAGYTIEDYNTIQQRVNDAYASGRDLHEWTNKANAKLHYW